MERVGRIDEEADRSDHRASPRSLRVATATFVVALLAHGVDHLRRGLDASPAAVQLAGNAQLVLAGVTTVMVARRHRAAALVATAVGFGSAIGFSLSHLLPEWGAFSDSFVEPAAGVNAYSWVTAVAEIAAGAALGVVGWRAMRAGSPHPAAVS
ncbi:MAG: hypothetical protein R2715_13990 [Ilumatobacteraceae bacterium]